MTKKERVTYWHKLVKEHAQSSLSVTDFCRGPPDQSPEILPLAPTF